jgi:protocatechuate 3,4-dioxygenase beta subunit
MTIKPGAYPWPNHPFAWRPQHIHFSLLGNAPVQRLVTQMYFPGDPLLLLDPIFNSVPDAARGRMLATLTVEGGIENVALAYRFDIVLSGAKSTPLGI